MLYDKEFLLKLDKSKNKTIYARITALQFNESPIEYIEGRVTGGSINIDGASAVRRTCSLTMVAQDFDYNDYYWGLNTKFKLQVGVQNLVDSTMPDIIWFDQGIYLITSFNTSRSTNNFTISISGKDKMCLLNGEVGGSLESSVDFGTIEEEDARGVWTIRSLPIQEIIRNAVHTYAGEPYWNIVINDLDTYGLELLEYRYDTPMYLYRNPGVDNNVFHNVVMENDNTIVYYEASVSATPVHLYEIDANHLDVLVDSLMDGANAEPESVYIRTKSLPKDRKLVADGGDVVLLGGWYFIPYVFAKVEYGQTAGYRVTDLTYPGDLIAGVGEAVTSILDKIKNMLTEFEYFYDLDGRFVFQKKKSFTSTLWSPLSTDGTGDEAITESLMLASATAYTFSGGELITAFNNNPNLLNLRNDYSIWGERTGTSGANIPIHMRYAIDRKPTSYTTIKIENQEDFDAIERYNKKYGTTLSASTTSTTYTIEDTDWREIIYQMALDYYKYNILDNFELLLIKANPEYLIGQTGYEKYYIDLQGFWRELYNPELQDKIDKAKNQILNLQNIITNGYTDSDGNQIKSLETQISEMEQKIKEAHSNKDDSLSDLQTQLKDLQLNLRSAEIDLADWENKLENYETDIQNYYYEEDAGNRKYWNRNVYECPETLNFWFDFLDTEGELQQFSVKNVGSRSKSINDTSIKSIYFRETPAVVFTNDITKEDQIPSYRYAQIPESLMTEMFSISGQGKSAKDKLDELIYQHGYCIESATITAIPVYYLEPNTRIYLHDEDTNLNGDYVVSKITLPLTYNGTMSITATKAAESLF